MFSMRSLLSCSSTVVVALLSCLSSFHSAHAIDMEYGQRLVSSSVPDDQTTTASSLQTKWENFVLYAMEYEKEYRLASNEDPLVQKRFQAFQKNLDRIESHNQKFQKGETSFTLAVNHLADLTDDEYKQLLGYRKSTTTKAKSTGGVFAPSSSVLDDLPVSWDWRQHNVVTPVKNQGQCGSCWAFSAVASMESVYALATGKLESFSEQELVDCVMNGKYTCTYGGEMQDGFEEIVAHHNGKIDPEDVYPYTATSKGVCKAQDDKAIGHFTSYQNVSVGDENSLKAAVALQGVVSIAIDASSFAFQLYHQGVFHWPACSSQDLDHGVAAVGYGTFKGKEFWLVKNSWGEGWGMHGYIMMSRNKKNHCGVATDASFVVMPKEQDADDRQSTTGTTTSAEEVTAVM